MKTLLYYKNKFKYAKTHTGRNSAKKNAEKNLSDSDYEKFLEWEKEQPEKPKRIKKSFLNHF